ncbi:MAG: hypothetical protein H5U07_01840 [Candidatus Aminicenantes bacterium]|nr:hypothetical protein [Candidatus Aminicenantes bacterium]
MSIYKCLQSGIQQGFSHLRLAFYLWAIFLVISVITVIPLISLIGKNLGHSLLGQPVAMPFELNLVEIFLNHQALLGPYLSLLLVFALFLAIFSFFLNGGLFGRVLSAEKTNLRDFLADGTRFFWRFFLSGLAFIPFFLILLISYRILVSPLNLWTEKAVTEWPLIIASNLKLILFLLLWTIFRLSLDLVRIILVKEGDRVIPSLRATFLFLRRHFFRFWSLFLWLGLVYLLITLVFFFLGKLFSSQQLAGLIMLIILGQAQIFFRVFFRIVFISAESCYYMMYR